MTTMTTKPATWKATSRLETFNVSGTKRPGSGSLELVMEASGRMWTKEEWEKDAEKLRYARRADGKVTSHGSVLQGYEHSPDEDLSEWSRW